MNKFFWSFFILGTLSSLAVASYIFFAPPTPYLVTREVTIRCPAKKVFAYITNLEHQPEFNYYHRAMPQLPFKVIPATAGRPQRAEWGTEQIKISAEVESVVPDREIHFALRIAYGLEFPLAMRCNITEQKKSTSHLRCRLEGNLHPYQRYLLLPSFKADDNQADPFADSLMNLKLLLER